jgi:hypothetical protein
MHSVSSTQTTWVRLACEAAIAASRVGALCCALRGWSAVWIQLAAVSRHAT